MSLVLARKYRPQLFCDLIGQDSISNTLSLALDSKRLSHAYLFSGLRGSGKTSTARIFAKALICEKGESATPCNECANCVMANENRHMDIIEMDGASNRGIDDIKELIEHSKYRPATSRYKIFIIDEVHMLTPQAFNALLKTLEEPPPFVKFILATTDPLKVPATILSRTQHFRFKKIPHNLVVSHLEYILNKESIEYENDAIEIVARSGAGSLRDSLTLLDQAIVYSKNFVDVATITSMLGIIEPAKLESLIKSITAKDTDKVIQFIKESSEYECEMILDELTLFIKEMMFAHDRLLSPLIIERFFRIIAGSKELLKMGSDGDFVLYLTLFKMMESLELKEIDTLIKEIENSVQHPKEPTTLMQTEPQITPPQPAIAAKQSPIQKESQPTIIDQNAKLFEKLKIKIHDRDYLVGMCFERNIEFDRFENGTLFWTSSAQDDDREKLRVAFGIIKKFVWEIFGEGTQIKSVAKNNTPKEEVKTPYEEKKPEPQESLPQINSNATPEEPDMPSSCINPDKSETFDPEKLLEEPMVKDAIELLNATKVKVVQKS